MRLFWITVLLFLSPHSLMAAEAAFPPTPPGKAEIKTLPAGRLLESQGTGSYFERSNNLFGPLFRYISTHNIAMTTPVEARIEPAKMYFWVSEKQVDKAKDDWGGVKVIDVPERQVAALGHRGGYNESNYQAVKTALLEWVASQDYLEIVGEPFAVYWDGPMTPWFMRKFEVQVEVQFRQQS